MHKFLILTSLLVLSTQQAFAAARRPATKPALTRTDSGSFYQVGKGKIDMVTFYLEKGSSVTASAAGSYTVDGKPVSKKEHKVANLATDFHKNNLEYGIMQFDPATFSKELKECDKKRKELATQLCLARNDSSCVIC